MVIMQRRESILRHLEEHGETSVNELSSRLGMSEMTIRRDLRRMEERGVLRRFHGGAASREQVREVAYFEQKGAANLREKNLIAEAIAGMVPVGSTVFCNAGTTTLAVMSRIRNENVRIITNNALAPSLAADGSGELICTGGLYQERTRSFGGEFATYIISKTHADVCVLGVNGVSAASGVTTAVYNETLINEMMARRCKGQTIIAADGSKIGKVSYFTSMPLSRITMLVTDSSADMEEVARMRDAGLQVRIVDA